MSDSFIEFASKNLGTVLRRYLRRRTPVRLQSEIEDMMQDCFLRWSRIKTANVNDPVGYAKRTARNIIIERGKRAEFRGPDSAGDYQWLEETWAEFTWAYTAHEPNLDEEIDTEQAVATLRTYMDRLSTAAADALLMHYGEGMTYGEIAVVLNVSEAMVKKYCTTGRQILLGKRAPTRKRRAPRSVTAEVQLQRLIERTRALIAKHAADSELAQRYQQRLAYIQLHGVVTHWCNDCHVRAARGWRCDECTSMLGGSQYNSALRQHTAQRLRGKSL